MINREHDLPITKQAQVLRISRGINTYQDGYGNTTGTIGRDRVNIQTDPSGHTIGTIGG